MATTGELIERTRQLLETACAAAEPGRAANLTIRVGRDGGILILTGNADTSGACMAFRVTQTADRHVRIEGRAGDERCVLETTAPYRPPGMMLPNAPLYAAESAEPRQLLA